MATEWVAVVSLKMYSARPWLQFAPARMMVFYQSRWLAGVSPCQTREHGQREHTPGPEAETVYRAPKRLQQIISQDSLSHVSNLTYPGEPLSIRL